MMDFLIRLLASFLGYLLGMLIYDFVERKIKSIKSTPKKDDSKEAG